MTTPIHTLKSNNNPVDKQPKKFGASILGSSISVSVDSLTGSNMDSPSIFSMDHLHSSFGRDEVLVEKIDAEEDSSLKGQEIIPANEPTVANNKHNSVVSNEEAEESNGENLDASTLYPVKPFWYKGFLKTSFVEQEENDCEEKHEANVFATADVNEEESKGEIPAAEEQDTAPEIEMKLDEILMKIPLDIYEKIHLVSLKERFEVALACIQEHWEGIRVMMESSLDKPEFYATCSVLGCFCLLGTLLLLFTGAKTPVSDPKNDLKAFVMYERAKGTNGVEHIEELETEHFSAFARSACVQAETANATKNALRSALRGERKAFFEMAVKEGITQMSSLQDSKADFVERGKAYSFMAFWSTAYNPKNKHQTYESCVMVTGVVLTVAETVAEWTMKEEKYQVGVQPCYCGKYAFHCGLLFLILFCSISHYFSRI